MKVIPEIGMRVRLRNRVGTVDGICYTEFYHDCETGVRGYGYLDH
jgi:hypothetical protein